MSDDTLLVLSGMGIPDYSARGLTQRLEPIDAARALRRTVNGELVDLSASQFRKYRSTISCNDQEVPALEGVWPGMEVIVDCVAELAYLTNSDAPSRTVVEGSSREAGDHTFYRPRLTMLVTAFSAERDEWGALVAWALELEEV